MESQPIHWLMARAPPNFTTLPTLILACTPSAPQISCRRSPVGRTRSLPANVASRSLFREHGLHEYSLSYVHSTLRSYDTMETYTTPAKLSAAISGPMQNRPDLPQMAGSSRKNLGTRSHIYNQTIKPDKSVKIGPSCRHTNILQGNSSNKSLRGGNAPGRMS